MIRNVRGQDQGQPRGTGQTVEIVRDVDWTAILKVWHPSIHNIAF